MNKKRSYVVFLAVVVLTVSAALALANGEGDHYYACVNNASGTIHMVQAGDECNSNEELFVWNIQGTKGDKGDKGDPGDPGAEGVPGAPGVDGADGSSCSVTQNEGAAKIECTDGTNATVSDGADGADGAPGQEGPPGESWSDAQFTKQVTHHVLYEGTYALDGGTSVCPEGTTVVSGGYVLSPYQPILLDYGNFIVLENTPFSDEETGESGWQVVLYSEGVFDVFPGDFTLDVIAWCVGVNQEVGEPTAEVCDGEDNDLDSEIDEDFPNKNTFCTNGIGVCLAGGVNVCTPDGLDVTCNATPGDPLEVIELSCSDFLDNDCDGLTDASDPDCG